MRYTAPMSSPSIIYIGADHAGFALKESVKRYLGQAGWSVEDVGAHALVPTDDYPEYAALVATAVRENARSVGILLCGSAEGVCIAANKFDGIRAGIGYSLAAATSLRADDHGNVLCLPGRMPVQDDVMAIIDAFLTTVPSTEPRHVRRNDAIADIEATE